jgi:hypothetical protein
MEGLQSPAALDFITNKLKGERQGGKGNPCALKSV